MKNAPAGALRFYDQKFAHEADAEVAPDVVAPSACPTDRYAACVSSLPPLVDGGDVLEIGAGSGRLAHSLVAAGLRFDHYTVSDLSSARLAGLRRTLDDPRFRVRSLDVEEPAGDLEGRFDVVLMVALVEHLFDPLAALRSVRRMLRPGGFVYLDTPNVAKLTRRLKLLAGRFPATSSRDEGLVRYDGQPVTLHDEGHLHYFTYRSLTRLLLERCGFARVERLPYATPPLPFGARVGHTLARLRPQLFAELCLVAYAGGAPAASSASSRERASA